MQQAQWTSAVENCTHYYLFSEPVCAIRQYAYYILEYAAVMLTSDENFRFGIIHQCTDLI
jgi:hypothetical protein